MWCTVKVCRGPKGQRLPRSEWRLLGQARLEIRPSTSTRTAGLEASLWIRDTIRELPLGAPLFDVRVCTLDDGLLVVGYQIDTELGLGTIREFRQAWFCVPLEGH
jgi:hypothetical protein